MEHAIFISKIKNLEYVTQEYSRLYFGVEFCQNLIPSIEDLSYILRFVSKKRLDFTFVTPFITKEGLEKLKPQLNYLVQEHPVSEIIINDWGLLSWIDKNYSNLTLVLGRLLVKQKRGPRILSLMGRVPDIMIQHFRQSNVDTSMISNFLISKGINRIEFDNLLQGISRPAHSLKGSLYTPFVYVTTTRFCPASSTDRISNRSLRAIFPCNKECQNYTLKLQHEQMPMDLFLKGNTQFFMNEQLPEDLDQLNIDRLVYQPEIPL